MTVALDRSRLTTEGMMVGTVSYMPPEQAMGGEARDATSYDSAALLVYSSDTFPKIDLWVDEHPTPIVELRRVF